MSLGPYPEMKLDEARIRCLRLTADVAEGIDPVGLRQKAKAMHATPSAAPTFGQCADRYIAKNESGWKNAKHRMAWAMTLTKYAAPIRDLPVDQIDTKAVLSVL
jgi:Arm DNA-binding domain